MVVWSPTKHACMQGCYAAMLQPSQLLMGKGVSTAINSVLCQFSGLETDADDMLVS